MLPHGVSWRRLCQPIKSTRKPLDGGFGVRFDITSDLSIGNLVIEELQAAMAGRNAWR